MKLGRKAGLRVLYHCTYADAEAIAMLEAHKDSIFVTPSIGIVQATLDATPPPHLDMTHMKQDAATMPGGQIMGRPDELGQLQPGYLADLLRVDGDPTENVAILQNRHLLRAIMKDGRFHKDPAAP